MQRLLRLFCLACVVEVGLAYCSASATAEVEAVGSQTPWRAFLVKGGNLVREDGVLRYRRGRDFADIGLVPGSRKFNVVWTRGRETVRDEVDLDSPNPWFSPVPPASWPEPDFDDAHWARYQPDELADFMGEYGVSVAKYVWPTLLCLRTCFGVADPARAEDLKVTVTCLGGGVVYVNGQEVGRGLLPAGELHPLTLADDYPAEVYITEDGHTPLPVLRPIAKLKEAPEPRWLPRYERRLRTFTVNIPHRFLVKGRNVLAVELHRSAVTGPLSNRGGWSHLGVHRIALTSESGEGVIPYADAAEGIRAWSAGTHEQVANVLAEDSLVKGSMFKTLIWVRGMPVKGVRIANPYDPVLPVRMAAPRGGTCSGQTVLSDPGGLRDVSAQLGELKGPRGATIPAAAVQVRFAVQHPALHYCDALMPDPPEEATTVPVWTVVDVPKNQTPGWYTASLDLASSGRRFSVPVHVLVTGATLPDPKDFTTAISLTQSPDIVARHYEVEPWSPEHWRLMERSLSLAGQLGNDVAYIPVIAHNQFRWRLPLVRWVKSNGGLKPDFSLLEKYLDLFEKCCGPPKAVSLYIWDQNCAKQIADVREGRQIPSRTYTPKMPLMVQLWDPKSGDVSEHEAPQIVDRDAEKFYRPLIEGVRDIVRDRGWSERSITIGLGGDKRPSQEAGKLIKQWAPYARWNLLSHFSGDPGSHHYDGTMLDEFEAGKLIATGGLETGLKEHPYPNNAICRAFTANEFEKEMAQPREYVVLPTFRWHWQDYSPPLVFRTAPLLWCRLGRIGLDFWTDDRELATNSSYFTQISAVTAPGPDGAVPTVRFQMLREGVQDAEIRLAIIRAYGKLPEEQRAPYRGILDELGRRINGYDGYLSQHELGYDWPSYAARVQEAAAELEGMKSEARWDNPP